MRPSTPLYDVAARQRFPHAHNRMAKSLDLFEQLAALQDQSMVRSVEPEHGEPRFRMLETIHEYAEEKLNDIEWVQLATRHAVWYTQWVENASRHLRISLNAAIAGLSCEYRDGVLYLRGRSNSFYEKQMAQEAVRHIEGVSQVVNQIRVITKPK